MKRGYAPVPAGWGWTRRQDGSSIVLSIAGSPCRTIIPLWYSSEEESCWWERGSLGRWNTVKGNPTGQIVQLGSPAWFRGPVAGIPDYEIEHLTRPWKIAIKTLLRENLPPIAETFVRDPQGRQVSEVLGIQLSLDNSSVAPDVLVARILKSPNIFAYQGKHTQHVEAIQAARQMFSKLDTLRSLLKSHPQLNRVPMYRGNSTERPHVADQELNDLLKETQTLSRMYPRDYMILLQPACVEWPHQEENQTYLFDDDDLCQAVEDTVLRRKSK